MYGKLLLIGASLFQTGLASNYQLVEDYSGSNFFNKMSFFTGSDPTNGYVTYVNQATAQSQGLINTNVCASSARPTMLTDQNGNVYIGVDHTNIASGSGRNSVRVTSTRSYTHMLVVANFGNMPGGTCGTWPAL